MKQPALWHFRGHIIVEKTESSNNQAQIVYNQIYQYFKWKGVNCCSILLLLKTMVFFQFMSLKVEKMKSNNKRTPLRKLFMT